MVILAIISIVLVFCIVGAVIYARWNYGVLEALNIPVDNRSFLFGSTGDMHLKVQHFQDLDRFRKFGGIYGVYEGRAPHVHVCDPELIKLIFVKDVDHFQDRRAVDLGHPLMNEMMDFLPYKKWKAVRQATTPAFTASKIKQMMTESVQGCVVEFINYISTKAANEGQEDGQRLRIDCRKTFMPFMLDLTARSLFGVKLEDPYNYENKFTKAFRELQGEDFPLSQLYSWSFTFPALTLLAPFMSPSTVDYLHRFFRQLANSSTKPDGSFWGRLQQMLKELDAEKYKSLNITETTVLAQAFNGFIAGFDALTSTVSFFCYYVASNPEIQDKLKAEIDALGETGNELNYASEMPYLQACIKETLRLIPPFIRSERLCTKDWQFGNIGIKKGCVVMLPSWAANRNPAVYANPDEFQPERFLKGQGLHAPNPYGFTSFGFGPRNCIGEIFAMDALKLTCAHLVREFSIDLCPDTEIEYKPGVVWFIKYKPIYLALVKRS